MSITYREELDRPLTWEEVDANFRELAEGLEQVPTSDTVDELLANKVDKVEGKGLSTNDFTNNNKTKLDQLPTGQSITASFATKVDKVEGKQLSDQNYTLGEKDKLAGLESSKFKGQFTSLANLSTDIPVGELGWYANIDPGAGEDVQRALWDTTDNKWVISGSGGGQMTPAQVREAYLANPDTNNFSDAEKQKLGSTEIYTQAEKNKLGTVQQGAQVNPPNGTQIEAEQGASGTFKSWSALNLHQAANSWFVNSTYKTQLDYKLKATGGTIGAVNRVFLDVPSATDSEIAANLAYAGALEIREINQVAQSKAGATIYSPAITFHYGGYAVNRLFMDSNAVLRWGGSRVALDTDAVGIGVGQSWQNFASGRALNTVYVNETGRSIAIFVFGGPTSATNVGYGVRINGVEVRGTYIPSGLYTSTGCVIIPPGASYSVVVYNGSCPLHTWSELR